MALKHRTGFTTRGAWDPRGSPVQGGGCVPWAPGLSLLLDKMARWGLPPGAEPGPKGPDRARFNRVP